MKNTAEVNKMTFIKRILPFLFILSLVFSLAACEQSKADDTTVKSEITDEQTKATTTPPITAALTSSKGVVYDYDIDTNKTEVIFKWDFTTGECKDWRSSNALKKLTFDEGYLKADITAIDPHMSTSKLPQKLKCEEIEYIVVEICNKSSSMAGQIFFMTKSSPSPSEPNSFALSYSEQGEENNEWETIYILTGNAGWTGDLTGFRFDVSNGDSGTVLIKSISFLKSTD